jgi:hypothetical protein
MWKQAIYHKTTPVFVSLILCLVSSVYPPFKFGEGRHKSLVDMYAQTGDNGLGVVLTSFSRIYEKRVFILKLSPGILVDKTKPVEIEQRPEIKEPKVEIIEQLPEIEGEVEILEQVEIEEPKVEIIEPGNTTKRVEPIEEDYLFGDPLLADRRLLIDRLILEYVIAALIGGIIYALQRSGRKEQEDKTR